MNNGTKIRTALRIVFSIYTAFCAWQVSIGELSKQLDAPWLIAACAIIIVASGIIVDILTTYYNNDYTKEAAEGTGLTRQLKEQKKEGYVGEYFDTEEDAENFEDEDEVEIFDSYVREDEDDLTDEELEEEEGEIDE